MRNLIVIFLSQYVHFSENKIEPFIVGGNTGDIHAFPHSAFLSIEYADSGWICGSSLVIPDVLLTAAHCLEDIVDKNKKQSITALAGHDNLEKVTERRQAERFKVHEHYDSNSVVNDLALIYLRAGFPLGSNIKKIILMKQYKGQKYAEVAGWGVLDVSATQETKQLRVAHQKLSIRSKTCKLVKKLGPGQLCGLGVSEDHLERPAEGDSGSALVTDDYQQMGLVSYREAKYPALVVYTNITYYYNWITQETRKLACG